MDPLIYGQEAFQLWRTLLRPRLLQRAPFKAYGRNPDEGFDCIGLLIWIYRELGYAIDEPVETGKYPSDYYRRPSPVLLIPALRRYAREIPAVKATAGDIIVFQATNRPAHVGMLDGLFFWHVDISDGLRLEQMSRSPWIPRVRCFMRLHDFLLSTRKTPSVLYEPKRIVLPQPGSSSQDTTRDREASPTASPSSPIS